MTFENVYEDSRRAESYSRLDYPGTYYLAFRDIPAIVAEHIEGKKALDFGCGTGRSTRFLHDLGFDVMGLDIAENMIRKAREIDPSGDYRFITDGGFGFPENIAFDLILSAFTFDNVPTMERKVELFRKLGCHLAKNGKIVNLVSSPDIYIHEWLSFTTRDFPENLRAKSGDKVRIIMKDVDDKRPVEDILWSDEAYREVYQQAELDLVRTFKPLADESEPFEWINETKIAPWVIYILKGNG